MTEVPPGEPARSSRDDADNAVPDADTRNRRGHPVSYGGFTPPIDEVDDVLAAQKAMYTGPITIPVANSDPSFHPDPAEVNSELPPPAASESTPEPVAPPPFPVPPPPVAPPYVAPDAAVEETPPAGVSVAPSAEPADEAAPAAPVDPYGPPPVASQLDSSHAPPIDLPPPSPGTAVPPGDAPSAPLPDDELSRTVEHEAAASSTLDAILLLENELRRRQGLPPVDPDDEPPVGADASFGIATPQPVPATDAEPDLEPEPTEDTATSSDVDWLFAPPPAFTPPPLVEPPAATAVDVTALPTSAADAFGSTPADDLEHAPPPAVAAVPMTPPHVEAIAVDGPVAAGDPDMEGIDPLDRADLAAPIPVGATGVADVPPPPTSAADAAAPVVATAEAGGGASDPSPFEIERAGLEPTPAEQRDGHAARMFWLWFAANSSFFMVAVGAILFTSGMSLRQTLVAVVAGVALSALPLGLGTLAGKWSGQPTMVVSRATFGVVGNVLPASLAVLGRVVWGGVMLWFLATACNAMFAGEAGLSLPALVGLASGVVLAAIVAVLGFGLVYRVQRVLGILATLLVVATIWLTADHVDLDAARQADDGSWVLVVGGAAVVFSVVGLAWAQSSSDLARYQRSGGSGAANMLWSSFGVIVPTLAILGWGGVLAASDPAIADGLARNPVATLLGLVPDWFVAPLFAVVALGLLSAVTVTSYSGGLAIQATGLRIPRFVASLLAAVAIAVVAAAVLASGIGTRELVGDIVTTIAVPVAAWAGIFACELMIRLRRFHAPSLLARGGVYASVRWANVVGLVVMTAVGFGLISSELPALAWQGYLLGVLGIGVENAWWASDVGVLVALALGMLFPLVAGIPAIRRQERVAVRDSSESMPAVDALLD